MAIEWPAFGANENLLDQLIKLSRYYGSDRRFVLAGGGNTSVKIQIDDKKLLYVKASGYSLANIDRDGFVALDRSRLTEIVHSDFGTDVGKREMLYKNAILNSRTEPQKEQRPSVESLLHHLLPEKFVVHTHCTLVNALTCHIHGEALAERLFGSSVLWIPFVDPGYKLGQEINASLKVYQHKNSGEMPSGVLMANHGMIVSGDTPEQIKNVTDEIVGKISAELGDNWRVGNFGTINVASNAGEIAAVVKSALSRIMKASSHGAADSAVIFDGSEVVMGLVGAEGEEAKMVAAAGPLNPDQIVYCTSYPLWFSPLLNEKPDEINRRLEVLVTEHQRAHRFLPRVVLVQGIGLFAIGDNARSAERARDLYIDAIQIMSGARILGGIRYLSSQQRAFIENWEAEAYRRQIAELEAKLE